MAPRPWSPSNFFLAQDAHIGWGALGVCLGLLLGLSWEVSFALVAALSFFKEGVVDDLIEGAPFWTNGAKDYLFWLLGAGAAAGLSLAGVFH